MNTSLNGDQAIAYGALYAGVQLITSYPGSPGTGTVNALAVLAKNHTLKVEWCVNERIALEMAIGASLAGVRSLVCCKGVGMNVMLDPLMVLNLTGTHGGLVILLGDDPGAYGSQNDQDTRPLAEMIEMPMFEPSSPKEAFEMVQSAFALSEEFDTAVILRETRSFTQSENMLQLGPIAFPQPLNLIRDPYRFFPYPQNAVALHNNLHNRLNKFQSYIENFSYNAVDTAITETGIVAAGFVYQKLLDVLGNNFPKDVKITKLSSLYPLPEIILGKMLTATKKILVLEENEPYIEHQLKRIAHDIQAQVEIFGKDSNHLPSEGELYRWQIQKALRHFLPDFQPKTIFEESNEKQLEHPTRKNHCEGCPYEFVYDTLQEAANSISKELYIIADPGCQVKLAGKIEAKYAIGSAVSVAEGIACSTSQVHPVAMLGDSAFFHSTIPALCNLAANQTKVMVIVIDNRGAVSTGSQPTPAIDAANRSEIEITKIARACGIPYIEKLDIPAQNRAFHDQLLKSLQSALNYDGPSFLLLGLNCESR